MRPARPPAAAAPAAPGFGRGARILSVGIGVTALLTAAYFAVASHVLGGVEAKRIDLLWSIMWVVISIIYRPIEQLLSRGIARRRARGEATDALHVPLLLQGGFACAFLTVALALRGPVTDGVFDGSDALYWVLVVGVLCYAASYVARGWLAGHQRFGLYGGLVVMEALARCAFAVAAALGLATGQEPVALGIAAAPLASLVVVPAAFGSRRERAARPPARPPRAEPAVAREATGFAFSVAGIMLAEQALLNASVISVDVTATNAALAGVVFNVLLIARAPLQLFQSVQTSLLPYLAGLEVNGDHAGFRRTMGRVLLGVGAFTGLVVVALLAVGPFVLSHVFGQHATYGRLGLGLMGLGMGFHLTAGALNQAALARGQAHRAGATWLACGAVFLAWTFVPLVGDPLLRVELGYAAATAGLVAGLGLLYRDAGRTRRAVGAGPVVEEGGRPLSGAEVAARLGGRLVVLIPAYDEQDALPAVLGRIPAAVAGLPTRTVVLDDGSRDDTAGAAGRGGALVVRFGHNQGGGAVLRAGYALAEEAGAAVLATLDADGQHRPEELERLIAPVLAGRADLVVGSRSLGGSEPGTRARELGIAVFNRLVELLTGRAVTDCSNGYRAGRPEVLTALGLRRRQFHSAEILVAALTRGVRVDEVPVTVLRRTHGVSKKPPTLRYGVGFAGAIVLTWLRASRGAAVPRPQPLEART